MKTNHILLASGRMVNGRMYDDDEGAAAEIRRVLKAQRVIERHGVALCVTAEGDGGGEENEAAIGAYRTETGKWLVMQICEKGEISHTAIETDNDDDARTLLARMAQTAIKNAAERQLNGLLQRIRMSESPARPTDSSQAGACAQDASALADDAHTGCDRDSDSQVSATDASDSGGSAC